MLPFILCAAAVPTFGQKGATHPDFSGAWKLNLKKSGLSDKKRPSFPETVTITSNGLAIEIREASIVDGHELVKAFVADGQTHIIKDPKRGEIETTASWDRSTLVVVSGKHEPWQPGKIPPLLTDRWSLSKDGRTLIFERSVPGYTGPTVVYDKQ